MKKCILGCILLIGHYSISAQIIDDFEDGDLNAAPAWQGMLSAFKNSSSLLNSNYQTANAQFYIALENLSINECQWLLDCKLMFNTSSLNYVDYVLLSDTSDLSKMKFGFFVRLGGSSDEISLYKVVNSVESKIIDGKDGLLNASSSHYLIALTLSSDSMYLQHKKFGEIIFIPEGKTSVNIPNGLKYSGIRVRQSTSSFFNKHFFDDLYIGPVIKDTIPPFCDSVIVLDSNSIVCYMNEICDSLSLIDTNAYTVNNSIKPLIAISADNNRMVILHFKSKFIPNIKHNLGLFGLKDLSGNSNAIQICSFTYSKPDIPNKWDILITELMADPEPSAGLPEKEYLEIMNVSDKYLDLKNCSISDPLTSVALPSIVLAPDSFLVLYKLPSLNNAYDHITLRNQNAVVIHELMYSDTWYKDVQRSEGGFSLEMIDITRPCAGEENWRASIAPKGGSPGTINSVAGHLIADTIAPQIIKYSAEKDSILHLYLNEAADSNSILEWKLDKVIKQIKLIKRDIDGKHWLFNLAEMKSKNSQFSITCSGFRDCEGNISKPYTILFQWPSTATIKQIVINEILFNPKSGFKDFIEIYNNSELAFDLSELFIADLDVGGGLKNIYPLSKEFSILKPGFFAAISEDTSALCSEYICGTSKSIKIQLSKLPSMPDNEGSLVLLNLYNQNIDSLHYSEKWHFTYLNNREGVSLERLNYDMPSNEASNWHSASSVGGFASPAAVNSQFIFQEKKAAYFSVLSPSLSPDLDGFEDLMVLRYNLPKPDYIAEIKIFNIEGRLVKELINAQTLGTEGIITWEGKGEGGVNLPIGIYIVMIECLHPDGELIREKLSIVLAEKF